MGMEVDRIEIKVESETKKALSELDKLVGKLNNVSSALDGINTSGLRNLSSGIKQLSQSMQSMSGVKTADFTRLTKNIEKIGSIDQSALYKVGNAVRNFTGTMNGIGSVSDDAVKVGELVKNISKLGNTSMQRVIENLPRLSSELRSFFEVMSTAKAVPDNIIRMTNAMSSLASNGSKFSSTINGLSRAAKTLTRSNGEVATSTNSVSKAHKDAISPVSSLTSQVSKLVSVYFTLRYVLGGIAESIKKSMDFNETINLFQTSYKKIGMESAVKNGMDWGSASANAYAIAFIDRAQAFNDKLTSALSLDPNTMMNYQAVFAQISSAMGLTANTAENISESFTMLGNDIASLWNINTKDAMEKLQAGLTGQVRPLRELGVDITQANLQLTAYKYGVNESVKNMSQAEKVQLRWLAVMDQTEVAFGDMAKTINSPANQLRVLKQQWDNLSRSIGNVFLPVVTTILPYINAVVIALRSMIDTLATAVGFELPDYTNSNIYTDVTGGIDGISDATDNAANSTDKATKANEKYKKSLMGIDELNILSNPSTSSSNSKSGSANSGSSSALDDAIQTKTASYMKKFNEQLELMNNHSKDLAKHITDFFSEISKDAEPSRKALKKLWDEGLSKLAGFVAQGAVDFYNDFLAPVGKWALGKGIPGLAETLNNLLTAVDWKSINSSLDDLFKALSKMTTGIGQGLIDFAKDLSKSLKPAIGTTSKLLADSIKSLANSLDGVDPQTWEDAGKAIGIIGLALGGIKISEALPVFLLKVGKGLDEIAIGLSNISYMNPVALPALADMLGLDDWANDLYAKLPQWCRDLWEGFWDIVTQMFKDIFNYSYLFELTQDFVDTWNKVFDPGDSTWYEIAGNILKGLGEGLLMAVDLIFEPINDLFSSIVKHICEVFGIHSPATKMKPYGKYITQGLLKGITEGWDEKWSEFKKWLSEIPDKISNGVGSLKSWFVTKGGHIISGIKQGWTDGWKDFSLWLSGLGQNISDGFGSLKDNFLAKGSQIISGIKKGWTDNWKDFKKWLSGIPGDIADAIGSLFDVGKDLIKSLIEGIKSVHIDLPHLKITGSLDLAKGKIPSVSIDWYATGGFPEDGLFMANHNELVGQFSNGKTAVANNLQIQAGIEEASYRGYMRAAMQMASMSGVNNTGNIMVENSIYAGDEVLYRATQRGKAKSERRYQTTTVLI